MKQKNFIIDFHTHTILSDGELGPAELVRRAAQKGYRAIGLSDHTDTVTLDIVAPFLVKAAKELTGSYGVDVIAGVELTHVEPGKIGGAVKRARELGIEIVIVHGETIVEPVVPGTNRAALNAQIDILAHPGLIREEDVLLAKERGILLEISGRKGHSLANGHVAVLAKRMLAGIIIGSDSHSPDDLLTPDYYSKIALGAGLDKTDFKAALNNAQNLCKKIIGRRKKTHEKK